MTESEQEANDSIVLHPLPSYLVANVPNRYAPILQELPLDS